MSRRIDLIIVDPQHDFCDPSGALCIKGADDDMRRLADFIIRNKKKITNIHVTLDSHQVIHIAHPIFWRSVATGEHPAPFTIITDKSIDDGQWTTTQPRHFRYAKHYVKTLAKNGKYPLCIWRPHCLIGTPGTAIYGPLWLALKEYADDYHLINFVTKGSNWKTEHYSAIQADVPDPDDLENTGTNVKFLTTVHEADLVILTGEAGSHCLANTGRDACDYFRQDESLVKKMVAFTDAMSPVTGFESLQDNFLAEMTSRNMATATTSSFTF